jgi:hypothetical protein
MVYRITPILWPLFSPDFSLIEKIWDRLKVTIEKMDPIIYRNYNWLRTAVIKAWELITYTEIRDIIR